MAAYGLDSVVTDKSYLNDAAGGCEGAGCLSDGFGEWGDYCFGFIEREVHDGF